MATGYRAHPTVGFVMMAATPKPLQCLLVYPAFVCITPCGSPVLLQDFLRKMCLSAGAPANALFCEETGLAQRGMWDDSTGECVHVPGLYQINLDVCSVWAMLPICIPLICLASFEFALGVC